MCWGYRWDLSLKSHSQFSNSYILSYGQSFKCYSAISVVCVCFDNDVIWYLRFSWAEWKVHVVVYLAKKYHLRAFFFLNNNLKHQNSYNICTQTAFVVAHTEHTLPLAKAHRQRPTNTYCTFSHIQTETHSDRLPAPFFSFLNIVLLPTKWCSQVSRLLAAAAVWLHATH